MGSRGSKFDDSGIKQNKAISKAEIRIQSEGTQFAGLPKIGLQNIGIYQSHAQKAIDILQKAKAQATINTTVSEQVRNSERFIDKLLNGQIQNADGGYYIAENDFKTYEFVKQTLGYSSPFDIADIVASTLSNNDIFDMKYSDRYNPSVGGKKMEGQLYEFLTKLPDKSGRMHDAYVKVMNIHAKNGATYSIVLSVHAPQRNIYPIWMKEEAFQPRYNKEK